MKRVPTLARIAPAPRDDRCAHGGTGPVPGATSERGRRMAEMLELQASDHLATRLMARLEARTATVGIIGLGYAGLPLAVGFARAGFPVIGVDLRADRRAALAAGR